MVTHVLRRASLPTLITFNNCNDNDDIISKIGRDGDTLYIFNNFNDSNNNNDNNNDCNSIIHCWGMGIFQVDAHLIVSETVQLRW